MEALSVSVQGLAIIAIAAGLVAILVWSVRIVPQSEEYVVERLGRFQRTMQPGMRFIVPFIDRVKSKVSVLERQLEPWQVSVITRDNVEVKLLTTVFLRVVQTEKAVYRIENFAQAVQTATTSIVRNEGGKLELDELQAARDGMNKSIHSKLQEASEVWGLEITRTEVMDVIIDERTKEAQRQQLNAERERRARVAEAEGERAAVQLAADAELYEAQKKAEAIMVTADARAYEINKVADATRNEVELVGQALTQHGEAAAVFEIRKRQVAAIEELSRSTNAKMMVVPAEVVGVLGAIDTIMGSARNGGKFVETARPRDEEGHLS